MMDGIFTLQISKDIVPDFAMAKIDDFSICDLIFSSPIAPVSYTHLTLPTIYSV